MPESYIQLPLSIVLYTHDISIIWYGGYTCLRLYKEIFGSIFRCLDVLLSVLTVSLSLSHVIVVVGVVSALPIVYRRQGNIYKWKPMEMYTFSAEFRWPHAGSLKSSPRTSTDSDRLAFRHASAIAQIVAHKLNFDRGLADYQVFACKFCVVRRQRLNFNCKLNCRSFCARWMCACVYFLASCREQSE